MKGKEIEKTMKRANSGGTFHFLKTKYLGFDKETFNLVGWQTRDIYQNTNITYLSLIEINKKIAKNLFKVPSQL